MKINDYSKKIKMLSKIVYGVYIFQIGILVISTILFLIFFNKNLFEIINNDNIRLTILAPGNFIVPKFENIDIESFKNYTFGKTFAPLFALQMISGFLSIAITKIIYIILRDMSAKNVFTIKNSNYIKYIGFIIIFYSTIINMLTGIFLSQIIAKLNLNTYGVLININMYMLGIALIIILVSHIFKYGSFLQDEHDHTV